MRQLVRVFHLSVLILFLELLLIRWVGTEVNIFAYLQNAILIVCFLGLGMGCAQSDKEFKLWDCLRPLCFLVACLSLPGLRTLFRTVSVLLATLHDFLVWSSGEVTTLTSRIMGTVGGLLGTFLIAFLMWSIMYPLGILLGKTMNAQENPIKLYTANILGSLIGVWLFAALGFLSLPPSVWFAVIGLLLVPFALESSKKNVCLAAICLCVAMPPIGEYFSSAIELAWSPYQKLEILPGKDGNPGDIYFVQVNNTGYQGIKNNSPEYLLQNPQIYPPEVVGFTQYDVPPLLYKDAREILVVGAGTGNDIAGVLRNTRGNVTAVEIDPVILSLGRRYHPEAPYADPRVKFVVDDARSFFQRSQNQFDLIIFGLLDSHTTPVLTNARLDHFVYTRESIQSAKRLLRPGGIMVVVFYAQRPFIVDRIGSTLAEVFGQKPRLTWIPVSLTGWGGEVFVVGDLDRVQRALDEDLRLKKVFEERGKAVEAVIKNETKPTTDDWPYLYVKNPSLPSLFYLLAGLLMVLWLVTKRRTAFPSFWSNSPRETMHFFSLGVAFSVLEMYGLSQAALLFGSTWVVNVAIISGVLFMILVANALTIYFPRFPFWLTAAGLLGACGILLGYSFSNLIGMAYGSQLIVTGLLAGLPMIFSGILFARSFSQTRERERALAANLFGALIGGILQLLSFLLGIKALLWFVLAFYVAALFTFQREERSTA